MHIPSSDASSNQNFSSMGNVNRTQVSRTVGGEFQIDVRGLRLTAGRFTIDLNAWALPKGKRTLAAALPNSIDNALFEIGEVQIEDAGATLVLFGPPDFEVQTLIFV